PVMPVIKAVLVIVSCPARFLEIETSLAKKNRGSIACGRFALASYICFVSAPTGRKSSVLQVRSSVTDTVSPCFSSARKRAASRSGRWPCSGGNNNERQNADRGLLPVAA